MVFTAFLLGAQHEKGIVWRTSRQACLLCPWARHLTGRLHLYVEDRWPSRTSPDYNCEVANPACQTTLGYPPMAVRLVGGAAVPPSRGRGGVTTNKQTTKVFRATFTSVLSLFYKAERWLPCRLRQALVS